MPLSKKEAEKAFIYMVLDGEDGLTMESYGDLRGFMPKGYSKDDHALLIARIRAELVEYQRCHAAQQRENQQERMRDARDARASAASAARRKADFLRRIEESGIPLAQRRSDILRRIMAAFSPAVFLCGEQPWRMGGVVVTSDEKEFRDRYTSHQYNHSRKYTPFYEWLERVLVELKREVESIHGDVRRRSKEVWAALEADAEQVAAMRDRLGDLPEENVVLQGEIIAMSAEVPFPPVVARRLLRILERGGLACGLADGKDDRNGLVAYIPSVQQP